MSRGDEKFWTNKEGKEVHPDLVSIEDKLKSELVEKILKHTDDRMRELAAHKRWVTGHIHEYVEMLREKYELDPMKGSPKGNLVLQTYDGLSKVQIAVQTRIEFDEKLTLAKEKVDEYLKEATKNASPEIQTLITKAFEVDKKGEVDSKKVLSLKSYKITDPKWLEAMAIIDDAIEVVGSKSYIRFYKRDSVDAKWKHISLDFASIEEE